MTVNDSDDGYDIGYVEEDPDEVIENILEIQKKNGYLVDWDLLCKDKTNELYYRKNMLVNDYLDKLVDYVKMSNVAPVAKNVLIKYVQVSQVADLHRYGLHGTYVKINGNGKTPKKDVNKIGLIQAAEKDWDKCSQLGGFQKMLYSVGKLNKLMELVKQIATQLKAGDEVKQVNEFHLAAKLLIFTNVPVSNESIQMNLRAAKILDLVPGDYFFKFKKTIYHRNISE